MGEFDDALIATAEAFTDTFAETVTYKPHGGDPREIKAIVTRNPNAEIPGSPHGYGPMLSIDVENDSESGISTDEVDTGGDQVTVATRIGGTARDRPITGIVSQDAGRAIYEVR